MSPGDIVFQFGKLDFNRERIINPKYAQSLKINNRTKKKSKINEGM